MQVVPLYGRGTTHSDPRKLPVEGLLVPLRPAAQRPLPSVRASDNTDQCLGLAVPSFCLPPHQARLARLEVACRRPHLRAHHLRTARCAPGCAAF